MDFFFRRKKIVVDAFTDIASVAEVAPIEIAAKFIPTWWKTLKTTRDVDDIPQPNMKGCTGFFDLYKRGFIVPLWADLELDIFEDGAYRFISPLSRFYIEQHDAKQYNNFFSKVCHIKLLSPWILQEKSGVEFYWGNAFWNQESTINKMNVCPGVVSLSSLQVRPNLFFPLTKTRYSFLAGYPLAHIIPLSQKSLEVRVHLIT